MDYEQKYNEALERARNLMAMYPQDAPGYKEVFPELRESEDERIRKRIIDIIITYYGNPEAEDVKPLIAWLEKQKEQEHVCDSTQFEEGFKTGLEIGLRKQKEQKPAEWSEEDADILNCCISSIEEAKENRYAYKETDGDTSYDHEIAWLKSLRPSWKPSDNQMSMLRAIVNDPNNVGAESCHLAMQSLYNDLLKLK